MSIFGLILLVFVVVGIVSAFRRPRELPYPEVIDEPVSEELPESLVQPLGDACVDITRRAVELLEVLTDAERMLSRSDGMGGVEAAERFGDVEPLRMLIVEAAQEAIDENGRMPEEASWWLSFVLEKGERIALVDDNERVTGGTGGAAARGAVNAALTDVEDLLFANDEFAERLLGLDLEGWVKEEVGRDEARAFKRAVKEAAQRNA